jgi:hypothetical protein
MKFVSRQSICKNVLLDEDSAADDDQISKGRDHDDDSEGCHDIFADDALPEPRCDREVVAVNDQSGVDETSLTKCVQYDLHLFDIDVSMSEPDEESLRECLI